jgi:carbon-monoxide dehydrogenase small subunit
MSTTSTLIQFRLNGEPVARQVEAYHSLVEVVRGCGLHGARESCGQGLCGCCTVLVDGTAVSGCLYLATLAEGANVQTIEGGEALDAVQEAFIEC